MIERTLYTPEATADIESAYSWYEGQAPGLGEEFLRCVEARVQIIQRDPLLYPPKVDTFRRVPLRRFPYEVFYDLDGDTLTIYAVYHCSREPGKWRRRGGKNC